MVGKYWNGIHFLALHWTKQKKIFSQEMILFTGVQVAEICLNMYVKNMNQTYSGNTSGYNYFKDIEV